MFCALSIYSNRQRQFKPRSSRPFSAEIFHQHDVGAILFHQRTQGVVVTSEGEMATWKGQGVGKLGPGGAVSYRGSLYFITSSAKLASLNTMAVVFEYEVDAAGNTKTKGWEWK